MQVVQLLGGAPGGAALLRRASRATWSPGGLFAAALADPFEGSRREDVLPPLPDVREEDGWVLPAQPVAVRVEERRRGDRPRPPGRLAGGRPDRGAGDTIALDDLAPDELEAEAAARRLRALPRGAGAGDRATTWAARS